MKHDGVEAWEIVGSLLLNNLANKFDKNCLGLYRIDGLVIFKNINDHSAAKIRKKVHQFHQLLFNWIIIFRNWIQPKNCKLSRYHFKLHKN